MRKLRIFTAALAWLALTASISLAQDIHYSVDSGTGSNTIHEDRIMALPMHQIATTTSVTEGVQQFEGVLMRDLLALMARHVPGETVVVGALNDYEVEIPMEDFIRFDVILAHSMNGTRLTPRDKGPWWIIYPRDDHEELQDIRYDTRWVWQLNRLDIR
ncbi:molybdopterin-dependent oxidoreductase [Pseudogemmobacter hezensis]|uniref:molybdopterin-dependent oxidoreductase n=1 Tax=Pseudogemmobacter hezensis TaxID=2737662 RepID=UPI001C13156D|nr:molybdopterin-dependent oxidoreductase [Pseudogemmobacter hezensis]